MSIIYDLLFGHRHNSEKIIDGLQEYTWVQYPSCGHDTQIMIDKLITKCEQLQEENESLKKQSGDDHGDKS